MGNKKEIGRFFKEQITEKESQPTNLVWDTILLTLEKKKRYRFLLIVSGIVLGIVIGILIYRSSTAHITTTISHTDIQENQDSKTIPQANDKTPPLPSIKEKEASIRKKNSQQNLPVGLVFRDTSTSSISSGSTLLKTTIKSGVQIDYKTGVLKTQKGTEKQEPSNKQYKSYNTFSTTTSKKNKSERTKFSKHGLAIRITDTASTIRNTSKVNSAEINDNDSADNNDQLDNALKKKRTKSSPNIGQSTSKITRDSSSIKKDSIEVKPTTTSKSDKKKEEEKEKKLFEEVLDKASFAIHAGPTHYGNLSRNYPIFLDETNRKTLSDIGFAYGISINAHINPKVTLSTGLNMFNLRYTVKNVAGGVNTFGRPVIINNNTTRFLPIPLSETDINNLNNESDFSIKHKISYAEIPIELAFKLDTQKLNIHVLGGIDVFFLRKNTLSLRSDNIGTIPIGTANYLNNISFGSHIGLNVKYELTEHIQFYIKPLFKYQFTASQNTQGFTPYYLGVLTGLEFKLK